MLAISTDAAEMIRTLAELNEVTDSAGLRISASPVSSNGDGPELLLELADGPSEGDEVVEEQGAHVFLGPAAAAMLDDKLLDVRVAPRGDLKFALREQ